MNPAVRRARLRGVREAVRLLDLLEVRDRLPTTHERVDVYGALAWLDVRVLFKPIDGLVGAYIRGDVPGVMVSTRRPPSVQRFTAAHELGHAVMNHAPSLDSPGVLADAAAGRPRPLIGGFASYLQEVEADAFAGSFLLPLWLITRHARRQGWTRANLNRPDIVYQLSLRCGASYQAVVWALTRESLISIADRDALLRTRPRDLKVALGHAGMADTRSDAWLFGPEDAGLDIEVVVGDTVSVRDGVEAQFGSADETAILVPASTGALPNAASGDVVFPRRLRVDRRGATSLIIRAAGTGGVERSVGVVAVDRERGLSRANRARLVNTMPDGRSRRAA